MALTRDKFLTDHEIALLEQSLMKRISNVDNLRDCVLLLLSLNTGARASEILAITKSDINVHENSILIRGMKQGNDREIPLSKKFFPYVENYIQKLHDNTSKLFPIKYRRFEYIWENWRPVKKKLHALRHSAAIRLYKKSRDIHLVKYLLGHRSITNTMIYLDYVHSQEHLRRIILTDED